MPRAAATSTTPDRCSVCAGTALVRRRGSPSSWHHRDCRTPAGGSCLRPDCLSGLSGLADIAPPTRATTWAPPSDGMRDPEAQGRAKHVDREMSGNSVAEPLSRGFGNPRGSRRSCRASSGMLLHAELPEEAKFVLFAESGRPWREPFLGIAQKGKRRESPLCHGIVRISCSLAVHARLVHAPISQNFERTARSACGSYREGEPTSGFARTHVLWIPRFTASRAWRQAPHRTSRRANAGLTPRRNCPTPAEQR